MQLAGTWTVMGSLHRTQLAVEERFLKVNAPQILRQYSHRLDRVEARAAVFSEMQSYWSIPIKETGVVSGLVVSKGMYLIVWHLTCDTEEILQSSRGHDLNRKERDSVVSSN
jgi:hypothetical protein